MTSSTYKYHAKSFEAYGKLAAFADTIPVTATLFPKANTIAISEEAHEKMAEYIAENSLEVEVSEIKSCKGNVDELLNSSTSDTLILREVASSCRRDMEKLLMRNKELQYELEDASRELGHYKLRNERIAEQIRAIKVVMQSLFSDS